MFAWSTALPDGPGGAGARWWPASTPQPLGLAKASLFLLSRHFPSRRLEIWTRTLCRCSLFPCKLARYRSPAVPAVVPRPRKSAQNKLPGPIGLLSHQAWRWGTGARGLTPGSGGGPLASHVVQGSSDQGSSDQGSKAARFGGPPAECCCEPCSAFGGGLGPLDRAGRCSVDAARGRPGLKARHLGRWLAAAPTPADRATTAEDGPISSGLDDLLGGLAVGGTALIVIMVE